MNKILIVLMLMLPVTGNATGETYTAKLNNLHSLAGNVCQQYSRSKNIPEDTKKILSNFMMVNGYESTSTENMIKFLNENKDDMACNGHNYIKESVLTNKYKPMIYNFLASELEVGDLYIDFNAVDIIDGKPESVLDYIDKVLAGGTGINLTPTYVKEVTALRELLADEEDGYGAKYFKDFPEDVQERYLKQIH